MNTRICFHFYEIPVSAQSDKSNISQAMQQISKIQKHHKKAIQILNAMQAVHGHGWICASQFYPLLSSAIEIIEFINLLRLPCIFYVNGNPGTKQRGATTHNIINCCMHGTSASSTSSHIIIIKGSGLI